MGTESNAGDQTLRQGSKGTGCLILFTLPFLLGGCAAFVVGILGTLGYLEVKGSPWVGILVGIIFMVVAISLQMATWKGWIQLKYSAKLQQQYPEEPWKWKKEWATGKITSDGNSKWIVLWFFTFVSAALVAPGLWSIPHEVFKRKHYGILVVLIFVPIVFWMLWMAIRETIRLKKYGKPVFDMASVPGVLGGTLGGVILVPSKIRPEDGYLVRLQCIYRWTSGSGKHRQSHEKIVWEKEQALVRELLESDRNQTGIPVYFEIPYELPSSDIHQNDRGWHQWRLISEASVEGVDFNAQFVIPVFRTSESRAGEIKDRGVDPLKEYRAEGPIQTQVDRAGYSVEVSPTGEWVAHFKVSRGRISALVTTMIALGIGTGAWFAWKAGIPVIFPIFLAGFALLFGMAAVGQGSILLQIKFHQGVWMIEESFWGIPRRKVFRVTDLDTVHVTEGMVIGNKRYYTLKIRLKSGKTYTLNTHIEGTDWANQLADSIRTSCVTP